MRQAGFWVRADKRRLLQVPWNLLSNAIRHTFAGGLITVSANADGDTLKISVNDTGIGIAPTHTESIFEEYARVGGQADGTGLGLPVSRRLANLMEGDLAAVSEPGAGSTFRITLRRAETPEAEAGSDLRPRRVSGLRPSAWTSDRACRGRNGGDSRICPPAAPLEGPSFRRQPGPVDALNTHSET